MSVSKEVVALGLAIHRLPKALGSCLKIGDDGLIGLDNGNPYVSMRAKETLFSAEDMGFIADLAPAIAARLKKLEQDREETVRLFTLDMLRKEL